MVLVEQHHKVSVLLAEYSTLRSEVLAARSNIAQALSLMVAVQIGVFGIGMDRGAAWVVVTAFILAAGYFLLIAAWNEVNTHKFTKRIREIEAAINNLAEERLLTWETDCGWGSIWMRLNMKS